MDSKTIIENLDNDHLQLEGLFFRIKELDPVEYDHEKTINLIAKAIRFTHLHFKNEENVFEKIDYPNKDLHKLEHRCFVYFLDAFYIKLLRNQALDITPLQEYLSNWESDHKKDFDSKYLQYITLLEPNDVCINKDICLI